MFQLWNQNHHSNTHNEWIYTDKISKMREKTPSNGDSWCRKLPRDWSLQWQLNFFIFLQSFEDALTTQGYFPGSTRWWQRPMRSPTPGEKGTFSSQGRQSCSRLLNGPFLLFLSRLCLIKDCLGKWETKQNLLVCVSLRTDANTCQYQHSGRDVSADNSFW